MSESRLNPTSAGESFIRNRSPTAPTAAIAAGTRKQSLQAWYSGMIHHPRSANTPPAPMEWERFQIDCFVASWFGGNQSGSVLTHGPTPMPWK